MSNIRQIPISKKQLYELYITYKWSCNKIAKMLNCNDSSIYYRLKMDNIPIRDLSEMQRGELNHMFGKKTSELTKEKLREKLSGKNNPFYNKHHTEITKEKLRNSNYCKNLKGVNNPFYGKKHTQNTKKKISLANGGNGILYQNNKYSEKFNEIIRNIIRARDNFKCQGLHCFMDRDLHYYFYNRDIEVHHINYNKDNCKETNLITLCKQCNIKANKNKKFWEEYFKQKLDKFYLNILENNYENKINYIYQFYRKNKKDKGLLPFRKGIK